MELILIRHGKAEERGDPADDAQRALTAEGRKKLLRTIPGLRYLVRDSEPVLIWSSRLDRAAQTAEILADILKVKTIQYHNFVSEGDFEALLAALADDQTSGTVLIVGHEPHLGIWSQLLCGLSLPFKKGAAAGFEITSLKPLEAELIWFDQPQALTRLAKEE